MPAGELRERVGFYSRGQVQTPRGISAGAWVLEFMRDAQMEWIRGGESVMTGRLKGVRTGEIKIRNNEDARRITEDWQARNLRTGEEYQIRSVPPPDAKRQWIKILIEAGQAQ